MSVYHLLDAKRVLLSEQAANKLSTGLDPKRAKVRGIAMTIYEVLKRPLVTEKGVTKKDEERTLCFEVAPDANKTQVRQAVEKLFNVKVEEVRTSNFEGKLRRRGKFSGYRSDWKKAYVKLKAGEKVPEFAEI